MTTSKVAVFGAGAMGAGIAQVMAASGMEVVLLDMKTEFVEAGLKRIASRFEADIKKGRMTDDDKARAMGLIKGSVDQSDARDAELVIEAIIEDRKIKGNLFFTLNGICPSDTVFATNTSTLSVSELAALSGRPSRFLGLHFFNPVSAMKLVEVIPGLDTDGSIVDNALGMMKAIKKIPVVVQDCPGFLVNRILLMYVAEAFLCAEEGISPSMIDTEAKNAGFPMGPLELSDMVGLDVALHTQPELHEAYGVRFAFPEIIRKLNDAGRLGLKTGKGVYAEGKVDEEFKAMVGATEEKQGCPFSVDRTILRAVNEAIYCLQEGVASADDIDRAMVLGTGFPNNGPLHLADEKGLDWVLATLDGLAKTRGPRFWPHHLLKTYVATGRLGKRTGRGFFTY